MATGATNALPTWGETTGYVDSTMSSYKQDFAKDTFPLYITSATTKYSYSTDWTGALVITNYGREVHGCIYFKATHSFTLTNSNIGSYDFVEFTLAMPVGTNYSNLVENYNRGCLFCLTDNSTKLTSQAGIKISLATNKKTITISPRYLGANWSLTDGMTYSITW